MQRDLIPKEPEEGQNFLEVGVSPLGSKKHQSILTGNSWTGRSVPPLQRRPICTRHGHLWAQSARGLDSSELGQYRAWSAPGLILHAPGPALGPHTDATLSHSVRPLQPFSGTSTHQSPDLGVLPYSTCHHTPGPLRGPKHPSS